MTFSSSSQVVYLTMFVLVCLAIPSEAGLKVYSLKGNGLKGDALGNAPDAYVKVFIDNKLVGQTSVAQNSFNPSWPNSFSNTAAKVNSQLKLQVWDKDAKIDDLLGTCTIKVQSGTHKSTCNLSKGTLTYIYQV